MLELQTQRPRLQVEAQSRLAHTIGPAALAEVQTAEGGKSPATQPGPDPRACGGTRATAALEEEWEEFPDKAL